MSTPVNGPRPRRAAFAPILTGLALAGLAVTGLSLTGCTPPPGMTPETGHQNEVKRIQLVHPVQFSPDAAGIDRRESDALAEFLRKEGVRPGDVVTVRAGADGTMNATRRERVLDQLKRSGITATPGVNLADPADRDTVLVTVTRWDITPPTCPNWDRATEFDPFNRPAGNFGCATASNLYLMVADPRDLAVGRTPGPVDAEPGMRAVQKWREGDTGKAAPSESSRNASPGASGGSGGANAQ